MGFESRRTCAVRLPRLENEWISDESEKLFARFITLLGDFTYAGFNDLKLPARPETIIDVPNFVMPQPKKTGRDAPCRSTDAQSLSLQVLSFAIYLHSQFFSLSSNRFVPKRDTLSHRSSSSSSLVLSRISQRIHFSLTSSSIPSAVLFSLTMLITFSRVRICRR